MRKRTEGGGARNPLVLTYHPALNSMGRIVRDLHSMLSNSEEHTAVFPETSGYSILKM